MRTSAVAQLYAWGNASYTYFHALSLNIHETITNLYFHLSGKFRTVSEAIQTTKIRTTWLERGAYPWNPTEYYAGLYRILLKEGSTICAFWGCWRNMVTRASVLFSSRERVIGRGRPRAAVRWRQVRFYSWLLTRLHINIYSSLLLIPSSQLTDRQTYVLKRRKTFPNAITKNSFLFCFSQM